MEDSQNLTTFEFLLTLEGNIIIQRLFDVENYNSQSLKSMDLYYCVKEICEEISSDLKKKSLEYDYEDQYFLSEIDDVETKKEDKKEHFLLEIKLNNNVFISRIFPAYVYHPQARYTVDIRPKIRRMLSKLTNVLSSRRLEKSYCDKKL